MSPDRFVSLTSRYPQLRLVVAGDFCLDRYFELDPARSEISIETGLEVHNILRVRCQPGAAGTILGNLAALGVGRLMPVGVCGDDGEGWELRRALQALPGVGLEQFHTADGRHTFTYTKPLVCALDHPPRELNRLDLKNWTPTPTALEERLMASLEAAADAADGVIVMDQVDVPESGVVTTRFRERLSRLSRERPELPVLGDSRRGLAGWPPLIWKMNLQELAALTGRRMDALADIRAACADLARANARLAFVTLADRGIVGAQPGGESAHVPAFPVRGDIDIVGAGDAVTANLAAALAAGAGLVEAMELAMAAASVVVHQLGTTGTATVAQLRERLL